MEILKWIGIVLAGGFVGYFGRYMAMLIIERVRRRRDRQSTVGNENSSKGAQDTSLEEKALKMEKKRAKAEFKSLKKKDRE